MSNYLLQTLILVSYLISLFIIIHFLFSKEGGYWLIPLIFNLFFLLSHSISVIISNEGILPINVDLITSIPPFLSTTMGYYILLIMSLLWLFLILTFHHGFRKHKKPIDKRKEMMKRNYYGAIYTEKIEKQQFQAKKKRQELHNLYGTRKPRINEFSKEWINKFD